MPASAAPSAGRPRDPAVDQAILDAALALFAEGGIDAVSFEQIAKRSGVSRAAIYRRWSSRQQIVAFALGRLREAAERPFADWADRPLHEVLAWFVEQTPKAMLDPLYRRLMAHVLSLGPGHDELRSTYWEEFLRPRRRAFARLMARARSEGRLRRDLDPDLVQDMLTGALMHRITIAPGEPSEAQLRGYVRRLLDALGLDFARPGGRKK